MSKIVDLSIFLKVISIIALILNLYAILYSSAAKLLYMTSLYIIKDQCIIYVLLATFAR